MKIRTIAGLVVISCLLSLVQATDFHRENVCNDSNAVEKNPAKLTKNRKRKLDSVIGARPASKISHMLLDSDGKSVVDLDDFGETDPLEEGNRKILRFGKRVFESINKHGLMAKDARLLRSGEYRIDWWKRNRRLEGMRNRLAEELERNPKLKSRLRSLGWRNNSEDISQRGNNDDHGFAVEKTKSFSTGDAKNTIFYHIFIMEFDTEEPKADSPTKFSLNKFDEDFGALASDRGVVDVMSGELPSSSEETTTTTTDEDSPSGQVVDSDRILQLIPLVVDELRVGVLSEEERRAFRWIFGKRLWQLLEREASKPSAETMDHDLAKFLLKGQLPERDPENARPGRHQRRDDQLGPKKRRRVGNREQRKQLDRFRSSSHQQDKNNNNET